MPLEVKAALPLLPVPDMMSRNYMDCEELRRKRTFYNRSQPGDIYSAVMNIDRCIGDVRYLPKTHGIF